MLDLDGVADIVALDLNFLGGSAYDDDIGVWNGTGSCTTHHGESDCYADIYNLCTRSVTKGYWPVTECLFQNCFLYMRSQSMLYVRNLGI